MTAATNNPFGEIIASTLKECTIQTWQWNEYPPYGAFITVQDGNTSYAAIIHTIETVPLDNNRTPIAYKKTYDELMAEYPHIFSLLKTILHCTLLGTYTHEILNTIAKPARIHSFCTHASGEEIKTIVQTTGYIRTILNNLDTHMADNLIHALITHYKQKQFLDTQQFNALLKEYILYVGNDYKRINNLNTYM